MTVSEITSATRCCPICGSDNCLTKYRVDHFCIVKCRDCDFVYLQNPQSATAEPETYEEYFRNADAMDALPDNSIVDPSNPWNIYYRRIGLIKDIYPTGKLLEIGCGRGYFLSLAQKSGYTVQGIEISSNAARYAREKFNVPVYTGDMEKMNIPEEKYDVITLWHVLEHFYNPLQVLCHVRSMLNDKGILIIEVPNLASLKFQVANAEKRWIGGNHPRYHLSFFTKKTLRGVLLQSGFTGVKSLFIDYSVTRLKGLLKHILYKINMDSFLTVAAQKLDGKVD